jgi:hypothetical protein
MLPTISLTILLSGISIFLAGLVSGWLYSRESTTSTETKMKIVVGMVITLGWISATAAGIFIAGYTVSPMLHALMGAIVGYFFTDDGINLNLGSNNE